MCVLWMPMNWIEWNPLCIGWLQHMRDIVQTLLRLVVWLWCLRFYFILNTMYCIPHCNNWRVFVLCLFLCFFNSHGVRAECPCISMYFHPSAYRFTHAVVCFHVRSIWVHKIVWYTEYVTFCTQKIHKHTRLHTYTHTFEHTYIHLHWLKESESHMRERVQNFQTRSTVNTTLCLRSHVWLLSFFVCASHYANNSLRLACHILPRLIIPRFSSWLSSLSFCWCYSVVCHSKNNCCA
jgi:hypothetical protein